MLFRSWYLEGQIEKIDYEDFDDMEYGFDELKFSELKVTRSSLPTAYSIIPLKIMAKLLTDDGIVFSNKYKTKISTIDKNVKLKELENKIRSFPVRIIEAQEAEKHRISKEIHDDLGQSLATLKMLIQSSVLPEYLDNTSSQRAYQRVIGYIDEIIEKTY